MPSGKRKRAKILSTEPLEEEVEEPLEEQLDESIEESSTNTALFDEWEQKRIKREEWLHDFINRAPLYQQFESNHGARGLQTLHEMLCNKSVDVDDAMSIDDSPSAEDEVSCDDSVALSLANFLDQKEPIVHNDGEEVILRRSMRSPARRTYLSRLMTTSADNSKKYEGPPETTVTMERGYWNLPQSTKRNFDANNKEAFDIALSKFSYLLTQVLVATNENLMNLLHEATGFPNEVMKHIAAFSLDQPLSFLAQRVMQKRNETESKSIIPLHGWTWGDEHSIEGETIDLANASLFEGGSVTIFR